MCPVKWQRSLPSILRIDLRRGNFGCETLELYLSSYKEASNSLHRWVRHIPRVNFPDLYIQDGLSSVRAADLANVEFSNDVGIAV